MFLHLFLPLPLGPGPFFDFPSSLPSPPDPTRSHLPRAFLLLPHCLSGPPSLLLSQTPALSPTAASITLHVNKHPHPSWAVSTHGPKRPLSHIQRPQQPAQWLGPWLLGALSKERGVLLTQPKCSSPSRLAPHPEQGWGQIFPILPHPTPSDEDPPSNQERGSRKEYQGGGVVCLCCM